MAYPHHNVQQFTEMCLDCGANIYESEKERVERLTREIAALRQIALKTEGDALEAERDLLRAQLFKKNDEPQRSGW